MQRIAMFSSYMRRRLPHNNCRRPMRLISFHAHRNPQPLSPHPLSKFCNIFFAAQEFPVALVGFQQEALKIPEPVKYQPRDLSCKAVQPLVSMSHSSSASLSSITGR